jgi:sugar fermentation stimulation protein A
MKPEQSFSEGIFLKRYKRFLADIQLGDQVITAHVPNTGSLKSCNQSGSPCLYSIHNDPNRKIPYTLEAIKADGTWVGVNTSWPNKLAVECFQNHYFSHWAQFDRHQWEVKISPESRIDLVLWNSKNCSDLKLKPSHFSKGQKFHLIEIKSVTLKEDNFAQFPDAVTERGQKHLRELMHLLDLGMTAEMLFIIQRDDCTVFSPAWQIDPNYAELICKAKKKGLIITPLLVSISHNQIKPLKILPVILQHN